MLPRTTHSPIADWSLFSGDAIVDPAVLEERATTPVPLVAYTCSIRPKGAWVDWTMYSPGIILIAHIAEWSPAQAVQLVSDVLHRPIILAEVTP
ncbi:hypothetical protein [Streptacidiphilus melanogenes]|uniref:hypothetical protein n=1 Tax=Streptacidiphilus melanogenes TaxID=411235 RepID=UPI0005AAC751|nr:hypothetical protein [Streptacidiphilus melanogenes]